jgi:dipeptidyl-peptidase 4
LSVRPGVHAGVWRGATLLRVARDGERPGGRTEVLREGRAAVAVASYAETPVLDVRAVPLVLGPRALRAVLHLPTWYRPGEHGRLPVLVDPYAGAGRQRVTAERDWRSLVSQWFAEQGFAVLVADGRGTPGRGPDWEREVHGDLFGPALEDQVTALHEAAALHPLDLDRVGIRGWSFGGSLAVWAVLHRPDVFHAAVAGAGVTDQRLYYAHWRERFLGPPDLFPARYEANSLLRAAGSLRRPLLLMHGSADEKCHPANSLRLSAALTESGRPHELRLLPGVGHQGVGAAGVLEAQAAFLRRWLGAGGRELGPYGAGLSGRGVSGGRAGWG